MSVKSILFYYNFSGNLTSKLKKKVQKKPEKTSSKQKNKPKKTKKKVSGKEKKTKNTGQKLKQFQRLTCDRARRRTAISYGTYIQTGKSM